MLRQPTMIAPRSSSRYRYAVAWFLLQLTVGCGNDALTKWLIEGGLPPSQVFTLRLGSSTLLLLPFMLCQRRTMPHTPHIHLFRGVLIATGGVLWCFGLGAVPLTTATALNFTTPFFILLLTPLMARKKVPAYLWLATLLGFAGVAFGLFLKKGDPPHLAQTHQLLPYLSLLAALLCFALLDFLLKRKVAQEDRLATMFYAHLVAALLTFGPAYRYGRMPTLPQAYALLSLGMGGILLLYSLLRAYKHTEVASLAPLRYLEVLLAGILDYLLFGHLPEGYELLGIALITLVAIYTICRQEGTKQSVHDKEG